MATTHATPRPRTRFHLRALADITPDASRLTVVENTLAALSPQLAADVEAEARRLVRDEGLGEVRLRVKACRDDEDRLRFVCKVETAPQVDVEVMPPWRWWSGILDDAEGFGASLAEGLRLRRERLGAAAAR